MDKYNYTVVSTTVRILEAELLQEEDYQVMLESDSLEELITYLDNTDYVLTDDILETLDYETFINRRLRSIYEELRKSSNNSKSLEIFTLRYDYHNLKVLMKQELMDEDFSDMFLPIGGYSLDQLRTLASTEQSSGLPRPMVEAVQSLSEEYEGETSAFDVAANIDVVLDRAYFESLREISDMVGDPAITETVNMIIDFENLSTITRASNEDQSYGFVSSVLSDAGTIPLDVYLEAYRYKDFEGLIDHFRMTKYGERLEIHLIDENSDRNISPVEMDRAIAREKANFYRSFSLEAFGPMPMIVYLHFLENETTNIRMIMTGVENDIPREIIEERLRPIYGL